MYMPSSFSILINQAMHIFRCIAVTQGVTRSELHRHLLKDPAGKTVTGSRHQIVTAEEDSK